MAGSMKTTPWSETDNQNLYSDRVYLFAILICTSYSVVPLV